MMIDDPISATAELRNIPKHQWWDLLRARRQFCEMTLVHDCRCLLQFCLDCDEMFEVLGFPDPESTIRDGLGIDEQLGRLIAGWLDHNPQDDAVPLETARVMALAAHGGDRRSEEAREVQGSPRTLKRGETREYIEARLARDGHDDLLAEVRSGRLTAKEAGRRAGFIAPLPTPFEIILQQLKKLDAAERARLMEILEEEDMSEAGGQHGQRQRLKMALEGTQ